MDNELDLEYFKKRLEERHSEILEGRDTRKKDTAAVELDQARVGRLSRMDAMQQQAMAKAAARLVDIERQRIQTALRRIEDEEYGFCIFCDEEIAEKRLRFDPSLLTCISCAQEAENK